MYRAISDGKSASCFSFANVESLPHFSYPIFKALIEILVRAGELKAMVKGGLLSGLFSLKLSVHHHCSFVLLPGLSQVHI